MLCDACYMLRMFVLYIQLLAACCVVPAEDYKVWVLTPFKLCCIFASCYVLHAGCWMCFGQGVLDFAVLHAVCCTLCAGCRVYCMLFVVCCVLMLCAGCCVLMLCAGCCDVVHWMLCMDVVYCMLCAGRCVLHPVCYMLCAGRCVLHAGCWVLCTACCVLDAVCSCCALDAVMLCTACCVRMLCTACCVLGAVHRMLCAGRCAQHAVCWTLCTACRVLCTGCCALHAVSWTLFTASACVVVSLRRKPFCALCTLRIVCLCSIPLTNLASSSL
jgi:hypothetical protein